MLLLLTCVVLLSIAIYDVKFHRIPNSSILVLLAVAIFAKPMIPPLSNVAIAGVLGYASWRFLRMGGGDIKLLIVIVLFLLPNHQIANFFFNFSVGCLVIGILFLIRFRTLNISIPLAPAISGAYLLGVLA